MGFGGGGSAGMTNHVHNSVPLQGGPLDFANDTISSMNAGSTTYSNGAALQELVIGNPGDSLVVNGGGTAPEWGGGAGGAAYELIGFTRLTGNATTISVSFPAVDGDDIGAIQVYYALRNDDTLGGAKTQITINNINSGFGGTPYKTEYMIMSGGVLGGAQLWSTMIEMQGAGGRMVGGWFNAYCCTPQMAAVPLDTAIGYNGMHYSEGPTFSSNVWSGQMPAGHQVLTNFTSVELTCTLGNWQEGSQLSVFAPKVS